GALVASDASGVACAAVLAEGLLWRGKVEGGEGCAVAEGVYGREDGELVVCGGERGGGADGGGVWNWAGAVVHRLASNLVLGLERRSESVGEDEGIFLEGMRRWENIERGWWRHWSAWRT